MSTISHSLDKEHLSVDYCNSLLYGIKVTPSSSVSDQCKIQQQA